MPKYKINPEWKKQVIHKLDNGMFDSEVVEFNPASKWLVARIARMGLVPRVKNLGAGVKRISIAPYCPMCGKEDKCQPK